MRAIFLLRGAPGAGKSTWISQNNLEQYTICPDKVRLLYQTPELGIDGKFQISQKNDGAVWDLVMTILKRRMSRGELCIVDATHYKRELLNKYKHFIERYRYRAYVVDFTGVPLDVLKSRNANRDGYKSVPDAVIEKMHMAFRSESQLKQVNNKLTVITPDAALDMLNDESLCIDWSDKERIVVFGDIHGCAEPLKAYFAENPINNAWQYVFVGDYLDRGIQNREVLQLLLQNRHKTNFTFLTGNHERWLEQYVHNEDTFNPSAEESEVLRRYLTKTQLYALRQDKKSSPTFEGDTRPQIESLPKGELKEFTHRFAQLAYFKYGDKVYTITHGGIPAAPSLKIATADYIKGVGDYGDVESVYESWIRNTPTNFIQLHGHRNINSIPPNYKDRCYNLCSQVEYGAPLRIATISKKGVSVKEYENTVFSTGQRSADYGACEEKSTGIISQLNTNTDIVKKQLSHGIMSYNFSRDVFYSSRWNELTIKARGLFLRGSEVVARGYDKFFSIGEVPETQLSALKSRFSFPVSAYKKENGFLGLISWDRGQGELFLASKSTNQGPFAGYLKSLWEAQPVETTKMLTSWLKAHNYTLVFEVIDITNDPHIIKYPKSQLILLDAVENTLDAFNPLPYEEICGLAATWGITVKTRPAIIQDYQTLINFIESENDIQNHIEGYVFRDSENRQVKWKSPFYRFWKSMRRIKDQIQRGRKVQQHFTNAEDVSVTAFINSIPKEELSKLSIIDIRDLYRAHNCCAIPK